MPLRTSSGALNVPASDGPLAAAASAAATTTSPAVRYTCVHYGVCRESRSTGSDRGEVRNETPRLCPPTLGALREVVCCIHGAHQLEPLLASGAFVLIESH